MHTDTLTASSIGILADTHDDICPWDQVLPRIASALDGVDAIIHCGDICTGKGLADLAAIAPVFAVRSAADPAPVPPALLDGPRVLEIGSVSLGVVNALDAEALELELGDGIGFGSIGPAAVCEKLFGQRVDAVIFGGTHVACLAEEGGIVFLNPGSPSLAQSTSLARLSIADGAITPQLIEL